MLVDSTNTNGLLSLRKLQCFDFLYNIHRSTYCCSNSIECYFSLPVQYRIKQIVHFRDNKCLKTFVENMKMTDRYTVYYMQKYMQHVKTIQKDTKKNKHSYAFSKKVF